MEARLAPHNFIGVFDSGVGGMSVLKHLVAQMPHEEFHYFGDSAFAPYGTKPKEQIAQRSAAIAKKFIDEGAKALVIACNNLLCKRTWLYIAKFFCCLSWCKKEGRKCHSTYALLAL